MLHQHFHIWKVINLLSYKSFFEEKKTCWMLLPHEPNSPLYVCKQFCETCPYLGQETSNYDSNDDKRGQTKMTSKGLSKDKLLAIWTWKAGKLFDPSLLGMIPPGHRLASNDLTMMRGYSSIIWGLDFIFGSVHLVIEGVEAGHASGGSTSKFDFFGEKLLLGMEYNGEIGLHMKSNFNRLYLPVDKNWQTQLFTT